MTTQVFSRPIQKILTYIISLALVAAVPVAATPAASYVVPKAQREIAQQFADAYLRLADSIPAHLYDVDALAERLDFDLEQGEKFVRESISFDPYVGVLRGPEGTLRAEAGSAWDQATLLSLLIKTMGGDAMIVRGELSEVDTKRLLESAFEPRQAFVEPLDAEVVIEAFDSFLSPAQISQIRNSGKYSDSSSELKERLAILDTVAGNLSQALDDAGSPVSEIARLAELQEGISDSYVWVRYRESPNKKWRAAHPAFRGIAAPDVIPLEFVADTAPSEWVHFLEIELEIERTFNEKSTVEAIMAPYRGTVASFASTHNQLDIAPNRLPVSSEDNPEFFAPAINGRAAAAAKAFTISGLTAPAADAVGGPAIFATVSDKFGSALSGLGGAAGRGDDLPRLTGVILKVTHIAPGGEPKTEMRRISDFREEMSADAWKDVVQSITFGVLTGSTNGSREARGTLAKMGKDIRALPYLLAFLDEKITPKAAVSHPAFKQSHSDITWPELAMMANTFVMPTAPNQLIVRSAPLVINKRILARTNERGMIRYTADIMHNESLALVNQNGDVSSSPSLLMKQGIWETMVENYLGRFELPLTSLLAPPQKVHFSYSSLTGSSTNLPLPQADRMRRDIQRAGAVVDLGEADRWWRVNPATGQLLGMGVDGGSPATEYLGTGISLLITIVFFMAATVSCQETHEDLSMQVCCLTGNALLMMAGAAAGSASANALSKIALSGDKVSHALLFTKASMAQTWSAAVGAIFDVTFGAVWDTTTWAAGDILVGDWFLEPCSEFLEDIGD